MKNKYLLLLFLIGMLSTIVGALFKITHWEIGFLTGTKSFSFGLFLEANAAVLFILKLILNKKNSFLNK